MPTSNSTRSQAQAQAQAEAQARYTLYERLLKRAKAVRLTGEIAISLISAAKTTLELYPMDSSESSPRPPAEEVEAFMRTLLPSPAEIFTEQFIRSPLFPVVLLGDVANFYGSAPPHESFMEALGLSDYEVGSENIMAYVWFAHFAGCDTEFTRGVIECYKRTRGSPNTLISRSAEIQGYARVPQNTQRQTQSPPSQAARDWAQIFSQSQGHSQGSNENASSEYPPRAPSNPSPRAPQPTDRNNGAPAPPNDYDDTRKASYVHQYFKDRKFTGNIRQSINLALRDYAVCARQHKLSRTQLAEYFVNILDGPARTFFFNNAQEGMSFEDMGNMMLREYNSDARQLHVQGILEGLRLKKLMEENGITNISEALTKIINLIEELTPQCQPQFRSDANKISYLRKAVLSYEWAKGPISNIITARYTFNSFVTALRESIQLNNEINLVSHSPESTHLSLAENTHYQQYGRHPKFVRKYEPSQRSGKAPYRRLPSRSFEESRRRNECHKCGDRWSPRHRCRPGAIREHVRERLRNGASSVHIVSDLVLGLEGELDDDMDRAGSRDGENLSANREENEEPDTEVCLSESTPEVALFDSLTSEADLRDTRWINSVDEAWFTNHLSSSMQKDEKPLQLTSEMDFQVGDKA